MPTTVRPDWVHAVADAAQSAAAGLLDVRSLPLEAVTALVSKTPPPHSRLERVLVVHLVQRAGWELLSNGVERGILSHAQAYSQLRHIVSGSEQLNWSDVEPARLQTTRVKQSYVTATRIREYVDQHASNHLTLSGIARHIGTSTKKATQEC